MNGDLLTYIFNKIKIKVSIESLEEKINMKQDRGNHYISSQSELSK